MEQAKKIRHPLLIAAVIALVLAAGAFGVTQLVSNKPAAVEDGTDTNVADPQPGTPDAGNSGN